MSTTGNWDYDTQVGWEHTLNSSRTVGILERIPMDYLGEKKVRNFKALATLWASADTLDLCIFAIAPTRVLTLHDMAELQGAVTGWNTSAYEIMRFGERRLHNYAGLQSPGRADRSRRYAPISFLR